MIKLWYKEGKHTIDVAGVYENANNQLLYFSEELEHCTCKDCKHFTPEPDYPFRRSRFSVCGLVPSEEITENHYCAKWEEKDEEKKPSH